MDNGGYASKEEIGEALDALGYRILWVVSYVDTGEVREEYKRRVGSGRALRRIARRRFLRQLCGAIAATRGELTSLRAIKL